MGAEAFDEFAEDGVEVAGDGIAGGFGDSGDVGDASAHVLESFLVRLVVGDAVDRDGGIDEAADAPGEVDDGDLLGASDVEDASDGAVVVGEVNQGGDDVGDVGEAAGLEAVAVDGEGSAGEGLLDEAWDDHSVATDLAGADGVEEADDDDGEVLLSMVGQRKELVDGLGAGVAPALVRGGAEDHVVGFAEGDDVGLAVDLGGGGDDNLFLFLVRVLEDELGAIDVGLDRLDGIRDDEAHADRRGQVEDHVGAVDLFGEDGLVGDGVDAVMKALVGLEVLDIIDGAGGEVVDDVYGVAVAEEPFDEVTADEAGASGDEVFHRTLRRRTFLTGQDYLSSGFFQAKKGSSAGIGGDLGAPERDRSSSRR